MSIMRPQMIINVNFAALFAAKKLFNPAVKSNTLSSMHSIGSATRKAPPKAATNIITVNTPTIEVLYSLYLCISYKNWWKISKSCGKIYCVNSIENVLCWLKITYVFAMNMIRIGSPYITGSIWYINSCIWVVDSSIVSIRLMICTLMRVFIRRDCIRSLELLGSTVIICH